jgi:Xaa-Pro aminopeptidase
MVDHGLAALVLTNPLSIRYATDYRAYALFQSHIPSAYLFVPAEGAVVMFGAYVGGLETIDDTRPSHAPTAFDAGLDMKQASVRWADDIRICLHENGLGPDAVVGVERLQPTTLGALAAAGVAVVDGEPTVELARSRKSELEVAALSFSITVAEHGMTRMAAMLEAGITENQLWSVLHTVNVVNDGDWIDGRVLCSGPRTNPWYQEAGDRAVERGDLVAFDTDMIGPYGYCADVSRTWVCGADPTADQRDLFARAKEEIDHNTALLHVGASFAELSQLTFRQPAEIAVNRYACAFHGVGMSDEYPKIPYPQDWAVTGYDGEIEDGTVLSVESYVGRRGGSEGVKLEQMVQVTTTGVRALSHYPIDLVPGLASA